MNVNDFLDFAMNADKMKCRSRQVTDHLFRLFEENNFDASEFMAILFMNGSAVGMRHAIKPKDMQMLLDRVMQIYNMKYQEFHGDENE